jgi:hypothetical protein
MTDITNATIQLVYDTGASMTVELDVVDVYDISSDTFSDTALTPIYTLLANSMYNIRWGWTPVRTGDFLEVVKRCEIDISIANHNGVELDIGREVSYLRDHDNTFCWQLLKNNKDIIMSVHVLGFGKDDPTNSKIDHHAHLTMKQNATALAGSWRIVTMDDGANKPTFATALPDGSPPRDIFSMDTKVNPK